MLTDTQLREYLIFTHQVPEKARDYICLTRSSEPSRMVGTHARNNAVSFVPSKKMGHTISTESRGPERFFALQCEHDDEVLEYWDQPPPLSVIRTDAKGVKRQSSYTPDFLILTESGPRLVEVKPLDKIRNLVRQRPFEWQMDEQHEIYKFLPAERACAEIGIDFEIFVYSSRHRYRHANFAVMAKALETEIEVPALEKAFEISYAWSLHDLKNQLNLSSFAPLVRLIADGELHFEIDESLITEPRGCIVVRDKLLIHEANRKFKALSLFDPEAATAKSLKEFPCERHAQEALNKISRIESGEKSRSTRRWRAEIKRGKRDGLSAFQSLLPRYGAPRRARMHPVVKKTLVAYINDIHSTMSGLSIYRSWIAYRVKASEEHPATKYVCRETFSRYVENCQQRVAFGRGGWRAKNAKESPTNVQDRLLKADVPWQIAAIDHFLADIYLTVFSSDGCVTAMRPWITAMIDLSSKKVLGYSMSFKQPSRSHVSIVLRDCVRRHGKLPSEIIVDRGSEFRSVFLASMVAHYEITLTIRPASHPRYGSEIERIYGEFKSQYLNYLPGNTAQYKEVRAVDGKYRPDKNAVLEPFDAYSGLEAFLAWRDRKVIGVSDESIQRKFERVCADYPLFGRSIRYDDDFLLISAVDVSKYKVDSQRGIHIDTLHYWCAELARVERGGRRIQVRRDPENPHMVYGRVKGAWYPCLAPEASTFKSLDIISQRCEALKFIDSKLEKDHLRQLADEDLVRTINQKESEREQRVSEHETQRPAQRVEIEIDFSGSNVVKLKTESWS